jgi:protein-tyrosine phosphatase
MAEAVFQQMVDSAGLSAQITVDSVATSVYHRGERAHPGTRRVLAQHGINYEGYARQITQADVPDPFFTHNFDDVFQLIHAGCRGLLATIRREEGL